MLYKGDEHLILNGEFLPYTMLDFWRVNLTQILLNMTRGSFAEFLVQCALTDHGIDAIHQEKNGIEPWDIDGPVIWTKEGSRTSRIEVKSAAAIQIDTPDEKEPLSLPDSQLKFSIKPSIDWSRYEEGPHHNNDLYVFCHYKAQYKKDNMLDLGLWDFYVYPTFKIEDDSNLKDQKTISVYRLKQLNVPPQSYNTLYNKIESVIFEISEYNKTRKP